MLRVFKDPKFQHRIDQIAEKYNHAFNHCDIVVLSDFSIVHKGDFLSLLPDDTEGNLIVDQEANVDDVNDDDSDIESVILSSVHININKGNNNENNNINNNNCSNTDIDTDTSSSSSLHDNTVHEINEESEDEDETVEEEEDNTTISDVEIPVNRRYHDYRRYSNHDNEKNLNSIKAALSLLEKSVSSWEKRRNRSMDALTTFTSSGSRIYSLTNDSKDTNSRNTLVQIKPKMNNRRHHHHHHYNNSYHYTERRVGSPIISPSSLSSTSKERVIQWLRDQQLYLSQLIH